MIILFFKACHWSTAIHFTICPSWYIQFQTFYNCMIMLHVWNWKVTEMNPQGQPIKWMMFLWVIFLSPRYKLISWVWCLAQGLLLVTEHMSSRDGQRTPSLSLIWCLMCFSSTFVPLVITFAQHVFLSVNIAGIFWNETELDCLCNTVLLVAIAIIRLWHP